MQRRGAGAGRVQRWLLALLCLLASLAYLTRQATPQTDPQILNARMLSVAAAPLPGMHMSEHADMAHHTGPGEPAAPNAPPVPNAPPAPHQHAGHCPFCFTAAFALEAQRVTLPLRAGPALSWVTPVYAHPDVPVRRHADSRAPPTAAA